MKRKIRRSIEIGMPLVGMLVIFGSVLFGPQSLQVQVLMVLFGILILEAGVWGLTNGILPNERRYLALREEGDHFLELIRRLNAAAVAHDLGEESDERFRETRAQMHASVERMAEFAGKDAFAEVEAAVIEAAEATLADAQTRGAETKTAHSPPVEKTDGKKEALATFAEEAAASAQEEPAASADEEAAASEEEGPEAAETSTDVEAVTALTPVEEQEEEAAEMSAEEETDEPSEEEEGAEPVVEKKAASRPKKRKRPASRGKKKGPSAEKKATSRSRKTKQAANRGKKGDEPSKKKKATSRSRKRKQPVVS